MAQISAVRAARLRALREAHDRWVDEHLAQASQRFDPGKYPKADSDYNQHFVDIESPGTAQDEWAATARRILQLP